MQLLNAAALFSPPSIRFKGAILIEPSRASRPSTSDFHTANVLAKNTSWRTLSTASAADATTGSTR
ncbi:MAG: hypothetical protein JF617_10040 [Burkholderiales bacterium]|jgi:hypothetical protein|nr:hypothetical protein [Burkholderiales bacterium]